MKQNPIDSLRVADVRERRGIQHDKRGVGAWLKTHAQSEHLVRARGHGERGVDVCPWQRAFLPFLSPR
jgi:hypothetical protein